MSHSLSWKDKYGRSLEANALKDKYGRSLEANALKERKIRTKIV